MSSTSSTDDSGDLFDPLAEELQNVQSVIHVTRENIDALNAKFANLQEPPPMYITEYQELTSKLHDLFVKEHELMEQLSSQQEEANKVDQQIIQLEYTNHQPQYQNQQQSSHQHAHLASIDMVCIWFRIFYIPINMGGFLFIFRRILMQQTVIVEVDVVL